MNGLMSSYQDGLGKGAKAFIIQLKVAANKDSLCWTSIPTCKQSTGVANNFVKTEYVSES
jgi:hypothetical protein